MKILVKYNGSYYYWVDTVKMLDDSIYAILISNKGALFLYALTNLK